MQRTQTLSRSLTSRWSSLGVALTLANARTTQEQDELEMKTAAYELMMQHFQLRKVGGPAAEAKGLWANDLNPSTPSDSSISPIVICRKTIPDSSSWVPSHFDALSTDSEARGGRNVESDEDDEELRRNTEAARNGALKA